MHSRRVHAVISVVAPIVTLTVCLLVMQYPDPGADAARALVPPGNGTVIVTVTNEKRKITLPCQAVKIVAPARWPGWLYRVRTYLAYVQRLDPERVVVLSDGDDVFASTDLDDMWPELPAGTDIVVGFEKYVQRWGRAMYPGVDYGPCMGTVLGKARVVAALLQALMRTQYMDIFNAVDTFLWVSNGGVKSRPETQVVFHDENELARIMTPLEYPLKPSTKYVIPGGYVVQLDYEEMYTVTLCCCCEDRHWSPTPPRLWHVSTCKDGTNFTVCRMWASTPACT